MLKPFKINYPLIKTGGVYTFISDSGIDYEVRFARKKKITFFMLPLPLVLSMMNLMVKSTL